MFTKLCSGACHSSLCMHYNTTPARPAATHSSACQASTYVPCSEHFVSGACHSSLCMHHKAAPARLAAVADSSAWQASTYVPCSQNFVRVHAILPCACITALPLQGQLQHIAVPGKHQHTYHVYITLFLVHAILLCACTTKLHLQGQLQHIAAPVKHQHADHVYVTLFLVHAILPYACTTALPVRSAAAADRRCAGPTTGDRPVRALKL